MVWCRKYRSKVASFRCEACKDAVQVQNQYLCGRAFDVVSTAQFHALPSFATMRTATRFLSTFQAFATSRTATPLSFTPPGDAQHFTAIS